MPFLDKEGLAHFWNQIIARLNRYETTENAQLKLDEAKSYTDEKISDLIDDAPETLNTLNEIADAIEENEGIVNALNAAIGNKVDKTTTVNGHALSGNVTVTKSDVGLGNVDNIADKDKSVNHAVTATTAEKLGGVSASEYAKKTDIPTIPEIPPVNNGKLTIKQNGVEIGTFTANQGTDKTIELTDTNTHAVTSVAGKTGAVTLSKSDVGLGNVDNTADKDKSVNHATTAGSANTATSAIQDSDGRNIVNTYATKNELNSKAQRISLTNQCQIGDYRTSVIALCYAPTTAEDNSGSHSVGTISMTRVNGLYAPCVVNISMVASHGAVGKIITQYTRSYFQIFEACTFTYNGVSYGGIKVKPSEASAGYVEFVGYTSFPIFALDIHRADTGEILNEEVYNSISSSTVEIRNDLYSGGNEFITSGNIASQSVNYATTAGSANSVAWDNVSDKPNFATVAKTGNYGDLSGKPTIPAAANNGTLTIQKNGSTVATFGANQSTAATANITVPTKVSELTNDSGFKTTDNNTTYTVATGDSNGQIKVTPSSGSAYNVSVKGLGSAAYTASTAYAPAGHTHTKSQITDFPTSMPASDVYSWAKASSKPSYSWSEITSKPSTFTPASHTHAASEISGCRDITYTCSISGEMGSLSPGRDFNVIDTGNSLRVLLDNPYESWDLYFSTTDSLVKNKHAIHVEYINMSSYQFGHFFGGPGQLVGFVSHDSAYEWNAFTIYYE